MASQTHENYSEETFVLDSGYRSGLPTKTQDLRTGVNNPSLTTVSSSETQLIQPHENSNTSSGIKNRTFILHSSFSIFEDDENATIWDSPPKAEAGRRAQDEACVALERRMRQPRGFPIKLLKSTLLRAREERREMEGGKENVGDRIEGARVQKSTKDMVRKKKNDVEKVVDGRGRTRAAVRMQKVEEP